MIVTWEKAICREEDSYNIKENVPFFGVWFNRKKKWGRNCQTIAIGWADEPRKRINGGATAH